jgi:hypothetical protein
MAGIVERLWQLGRAHLNDFFEQRWSSSPPTSQRHDADFTTQEDTSRTPPPFEEPAASRTGLPRTEELVRSYRLLDLPFGTPMEKVTRQWKAYLKKCHPDRYAKDPAKQADATLLTQQLNDAHQKIKLAWERYQR